MTNRLPPAGAIRNRSGDIYKPSALRGYEQALRIRILPELGSVKLAELKRSDLQRFIDRMLKLGLDPSTIRNTVMPLRAIYRRALTLDQVAINPTIGLQLPAVRGRRDRIASPREAARLIAALPQRDQPLWATAMYAGLRAGELRALDWPNVDFDTGIIRVEHAWDPRAGLIEPKSHAGRRAVRIASVLRRFLLAHRSTSARCGFVFGRGPKKPFQSTTVWDRALRAWKRAGLQPIGLHECRHTFASLMIAAGVSAKALSTFMGHSSVTITLDRYGHLFPGSEHEAVGLLDAYLARAGGETAGVTAATPWYAMETNRAFHRAPRFAVEGLLDRPQSGSIRSSLKRVRPLEADRWLVAQIPRSAGQFEWEVGCYGIRKRRHRLPGGHGR